MFRWKRTCARHHPFPPETTPLPGSLAQLLFLGWRLALRSAAQACPRCGEIVANLETHLQRGNCDILEPGKERCQLCHASIPEGAEGWKDRKPEAGGSRAAAVPCRFASDACHLPAVPLPSPRPSERRLPSGPPGHSVVIALEARKLELDNDSGPRRNGKSHGLQGGRLSRGAWCQSRQSLWDTPPARIHTGTCAVGGAPGPRRHLVNRPTMIRNPIPRQSAVRRSV